MANDITPARLKQILTARAQWGVIIPPVPEGTAMLRDPVELVTVEFAAGDHRLGISFVEAPAGSTNPGFGLDYIKFVPVR